MQITFNKTQSDKHLPNNQKSAVELDGALAVQPVADHQSLAEKMHSHPLDIIFLSVFVILWEAIHTIMAIAAVEHHVL